MEIYDTTSLPGEEWRDVPGYIGLYQASNFGRVKSVRYKKDKILVITYDKKGYGRVFLWKEKKGNPFLIHRVIMSSFDINIYAKPQVNHIDGDKKNNHISNLEWCTAGENNLHSFRSLGRKISDRNKSRIRENNIKRARQIIKYDLQGNYICEYRSVGDIGLCPAGIWRAIKNNTPYKGSIFVYKS